MPSLEELGSDPMPGGESYSSIMREMGSLYSRKVYTHVEWAE